MGWQDVVVQDLRTTRTTAEKARVEAARAAVNAKACQTTLDRHVVPQLKRIAHLDARLEGALDVKKKVAGHDRFIHRLKGAIWIISGLATLAGAAFGLLAMLA